MGNKGQSTPYTFAWVSDDEMGELSRVGGQAFAVRGFYETHLFLIGNLHFRAVKLRS
jgi:hypothetical protein